MKENNMMPPDGLILPTWNEGDGPAPYVYARAPKGNRCAWSCVWLVKHPTNERAVLRLGPMSWSNSSPDLMTDAQLLAEIGDYRNSDRALEVYRLLDNYEDTATVVWRKKAEKLVREMRQTTFSQREFPAEFDAPSDMAFKIETAAGIASLKPSKRPGWTELYLLEEK
jgi:hypothetical protein